MNPYAFAKILKLNRCVINILNRHVIERWMVNHLCMYVSMYICQCPMRHAVCVYWYMGEKKVSKLVAAVQALKMLQIVSMIKYVMVAKYETLATMKPVHDSKATSIDDNIPKMVNHISGRNNRVPSFDHVCIHQIRIIPWTQWGAICPGKDADISMSPMRITDEKGL